MDERTRRVDAQSYATNLDYTLKELQRKVREHENELEKIRENQVELPQSTAGQAKIIQDALEEVANSEPFLPFPGSLLPALLALRKTHETIQESKAYLASQTATHERERRLLDADQARLRDQNLLTEALSTRIKSLRTELDAREDVTPEDAVQERIEELKQKKKGYDRETSKLMKALTKFIDEHLATMLAAEELGGPVVGDAMDLDAEDLAAGFSAQGKLKKLKDGIKEDKRQRRIDEIWGNKNDEGEDMNEVKAAAQEMRALAEELLNQLASAQGDNSDSYVQLPRESAAARFLVRSKVAQFHPKDASKLRLIDFSRDLEA